MMMMLLLLLFGSITDSDGGSRINIIGIIGFFGFLLGYTFVMSSAVTSKEIHDGLIIYDSSGGG